MKYSLFFFVLILCYPQPLLFPQSGNRTPLSETLIHDSLKANRLVGNAHSLRDEGHLETAMILLDSALVIRQQLDDKSGIGNIYATKSTVYWKQGQQDQALHLLLTALDIHEKVNDQSGIARDCNALAFFYLAQKNYEKAEEYIQVALSTFGNMEGIDALKGTAKILFNLSAVLLERGQLEKALKYAEKCADINTQLKNPEGIALAHNSIGNVHLSSETLNLAASHFLESLLQLKDIKNPSIEANNYHQLSRIYLKQKKLQKAEQFGMKASQLFKKINNRHDLGNTYLTLSSIYEAKGQLSKALNYHRKYNDIYQSQFNEESDRNQKELLARFESDKKEAEIALLENEKELKEEALKRQQLQIISFAIGGLFLVLFVIGLLLHNRKVEFAKDQLAVEKNRSEKLLLNILPYDVATELKENGKYRARSFPLVSVLFADIANFTMHAENLSPDELVKDIDEYFSAFDTIVGKFGTEKIKTIGDAYMVAAGFQKDAKAAANQMVKMGLAFQNMVRQINAKRKSDQKPLFELRIGIHTGPVVAGVVGSRKFAYDIWGDTVNIASRMQSSGEIKKVNISSSTYELVKDHYQCTHRGKIMAKHKGEVHMYFVRE